MMYGGNRVHLNRFNCPANSCVVFPSYLANNDASETCGIMFFSTASWNSGGGGRSIANKRKGVVVCLISGGFE